MSLKIYNVESVLSYSENNYQKSHPFPILFLTFFLASTTDLIKYTAQDKQTKEAIWWNCMILLNPSHVTELPISL